MFYAFVEDLCSLSQCKSEQRCVADMFRRFCECSLSHFVRTVVLAASQSVPSFILILVTMMFLVVLCVVFIQCQVNINSAFYSFVESYYMSSML